MANIDYIGDRLDNVLTEKEDTEPQPLTEEQWDMIIRDYSEVKPEGYQRILDRFSETYKENFDSFKEETNCSDSENLYLAMLKFTAEQLTRDKEVMSLYDIIRRYI